MAALRTNQEVREQQNDLRNMQQLLTMKMMSKLSDDIGSDSTNSLRKRVEDLETSVATSNTKLDKILELLNSKK